jgi:hypothetical protein
MDQIGHDLRLAARRAQPRVFINWEGKATDLADKGRLPLIGSRQELGHRRDELLPLSLAGATGPTQ